MKYAEFLPKGGTIGFVAPSFGCNIEPYRSAFENACRKFQELGYQLSLGPNCFEGRGIGISNSPQACAKELMQYYLKSDSDCLISCGGGELMCEILNLLDYIVLKECKPKWYMGYSDNTNFTYLLATICDTASFYGPCAAAFGMEPWHPALTDAMQLLTGQINMVSGYSLWEKESLKGEENPLEPYHVTEPKIIRYYNGSKESEHRKEKAVNSRAALPLEEKIEFEGRMIGGCMDCLVTLLGTRFDQTISFLERYREDGFIWFLEACDLNVFGIRRAMWQMENAGWFRYVKGFLFGRPLCMGQEIMGLDAYQAVLDVAGRKGVPVLMDLDIGHLPPMMPIVVGSMAKVVANGNEIQIQYHYQ